MTTTPLSPVAAPLAESRRQPPLRRSRQIQGNILAAFNKDLQTVRYLHFPSPEQGRAWLAGMLGHISVTADVEEFNEVFSIARKAMDSDPDNLIATWTGLSLTCPGLLVVANDADRKQVIKDLAPFTALVEGAADRAAQLGDTGPSDPKNWKYGGPAGTEAQQVHAVVTVASDNAGRLAAKLDQLAALDASHGVAQVAAQDQGKTLTDEMRGHEHFGFKDGISQPGIMGFHRPDPKRKTEREGHPGAELIAAGEFVFGYEVEKAGRHDKPRPPAPEWLKDGSLHVLRRLKQDVALWNQQVKQVADKLDVDQDTIGACFVGRFKSGRPLARPNDNMRGLGPDENDFDYSNDGFGVDTPCAAHIRKTHPRSFTDRTHRVLRRGIPYGAPFKGPEKVKQDRGLLFACYGTSLENQFEFVQELWSDNVSFAGGDKDAVTGIDPVTGPDGMSSFDTGDVQGTFDLKRAVTTTGAVYAITPSLKTLGLLAKNKPLPHKPMPQKVVKRDR